MGLGNGECNAEVDRQQQFGQGRPAISPSPGTGAGSLSSPADDDESGPEQGAGDDAESDDGGCSEDAKPFNNLNIPTFLDRTFRMIEATSNDIVCWSDRGDSFIIKKAR